MDWRLLSKKTSVSEAGKWRSASLKLVAKLQGSAQALGEIKIS